MTHKEYYNEIKAVLESVERDDLIAFVDGRLEALEKKSTGKKENPNAKENEKAKEELLSILADGAPRTIASLMAEGALLGTLTNQRISYIANALIKEGKVEKKKYKKYVYYFDSENGITPEEYMTEKEAEDTAEE